MSEELEVLKAVAQRLADAMIPYMVTGSMAVNFYAVPRMTRNIDLVIELRETDVDRFVELFQQDFYIEKEAVEQAVKSQSVCNLIHSAFLIKVDVVIRKDSEYRRTEFARRKAVQIEEQEMFLVAPEDLILSKLEWAKESCSEVQLKDVRNLFEALPELDHAYLTLWATKLGLESLYREVVD